MAVKDMEKYRFDNLPADEQLKIAKKGGKASGEVRAVRKTFKDTINDELDDKTMKQLINAIVKQAKKGNTKAFEILRDTVGEKPTTQVEVHNTEATQILSSINNQLNNRK